MNSPIHRLFAFYGFFCIGLLVGPASGQIFVEITDQVGAYPLAGRGGALGDYDNDGWPDYFAVENSFDKEDFARRFQLLHNEGEGYFVNRAASLNAGFPPKPPGFGPAFIDYDNDGDKDLYVSFGLLFPETRAPNALLRNDRGHFVNVTLEAGLGDELPTDNATWFDYDRDGHLDLYTGNLEFEPNNPAMRNELYRNNGDGTFANATAAAGLDVQLHAEAGGSNGGMVAGDFDDDGWPDLYIGVSRDRNRLFLNNGDGSFRDATTDEIGHTGEALGIAAGDIDNDGDLDLFLASGGIIDNAGISLPERSVLYLNEGNAQFLDVLEGVGLSELADKNLAGPTLFDIDNDGDLDLHLVDFNDTIASYYTNISTEQEILFENSTATSGVRHWGVGADAVDLNIDGFIDRYTGCCPGNAYLNTGNDNHWLRVELVGVESNRNGMGVRVAAEAGELRQIRDTFDVGFVHFGLEAHTQVDRLTIRWPSGREDVLSDVPADQEIRIIEGRGEYHAVSPTVWEIAPPAEVAFGETLAFAAVVRPALFDPTTQITSISADLSSLGGLDAVPLVDQGDGTYRLEANFVVGGQSDLRDVEVFIEQETSLGPHWINLSRNIIVAGDSGTAILEDRSASLPSSFTLEQNYPNPFNSGTVIGFALPTSADIDLSLYNLAGQRVATLASGRREAGAYTVRWDSRDDDGRELVSGVYLYHLRAGTQVETRKLLLLR